MIEYTEAVVPPERELECEHDDWVSSLAGGFSGFVVTGSYDKRVRVSFYLSIFYHSLVCFFSSLSVCIFFFDYCEIWNQETGECLATIAAHESAVKAVSWIAKTTKTKGDKPVYKLASGGLDRLVKTWRVSESGTQLKHVYKGHVGSVNSVHVSPNGQKVPLLPALLFYFHFPLSSPSFSFSLRCM